MPNVVTRPSIIDQSEHTAYRLVEMKHGQPHTLFHALPTKQKRSRIIPTDVWLQAEVKPVTYGRSSPTFESGFNVILEFDLCEQYLRRFTADRKVKIVEIKVKGIWPKPFSSSPVYLAEWMLLPSTSLNR